MEKILTQEEINRLLVEAKKSGGPAAGAAKPRAFSPFVFGKAAPISKEQVREVSQIHEAFVYKLKNRIGGSLQVSLEVNPMSVEETPYAEFMQSLPKQIYLASLTVQPANSLAILSLDLPVVFAMIDLMMGGNGKPQPVDRPATEIEDKVIQTVIDMICEELGTAWRQVAEVSFAFDRTYRVGELFRLLSPHEKVLFLSFEVRMPEVFSTLTLAFPATVSSSLLQKLAQRHPRSQGPSPESGAAVRKRLEDALFSVEMLLPPKKMRGQDVLELKPGQTVLLQYETSRPAVIKVAGSRMFAGYPVRRGTQRGGLINQSFPVPSPTERVNP
jgi:flagellar motor switch protein FliM